MHTDAQASPTKEKNRFIEKKSCLFIQQTVAEYRGNVGEENGLKRRVPTQLAQAHLCWFLMCTHECHHKEEQGESYKRKD